MADNDWDGYFTAIARFLVESERQYGVCNSDFTTMLWSSWSI